MCVHAYTDIDIHLHIVHAHKTYMNTHIQYVHAFCIHMQTNSYQQSKRDTVCQKETDPASRSFHSEGRISGF